jgi:hypothetical protein
MRRANVVVFVAIPNDRVDMEWPFIELRIHGVSGTSAVDLLQARPVNADDDPSTDLTRPADTGGWTRAFRWASLTSGEPTSASWILLLPYMLSNLAGWALPRRASPLRHRVDVALVRIVGGMLTAIFSLVIAYGFVVVGGFSTLGDHVDKGLAVGLGALASTATAGVLWWLTRSRDRGIPPVLEDPAIGDDWVLLRRSHLGVAAAATLWLLATVAASAFPQDDVDLDGIGTASIIGLVVLVLASGLGVLAPTRPMEWIAGAAAIAMALGVIGLAVIVWLGDSSGAAAIEGAGRPLASTVQAFTALALLLAAVSLSRRDRLAAATIATLIAIAGASGAAVGAASIQVTAAAAGTETPTEIGLIAEGFLLGVLVLTVFVLALQLVADLRGDAEDNRLWRSIVRIVDNPAALFIGTPIIITAVSFLVFFNLTADEPTVFLTGSKWAFGLVAVLLAVSFRRTPRKAVTALVLGVLVFIAADWLATDFRQVAVFGTLVLPAQLIGSRIIGAYRDADQRRALAVPWDVGSYFPSVFHPLAPPPYGATAVASLRDTLRELSDGGAVPLVVAAHSQGTVIASSAVVGSQVPVALFTFGSPIGTLYRRFFPAHFGAELVEAVQSSVTRWANLWRATDPVGGPIDPAIDLPEQPDPRSRIHGAYWFRDEAVYNATAGELLGTLGVEETALPQRYR